MEEITLSTETSATLETESTTEEPKVKAPCFGEWCESNTNLTGGYGSHEEFIDYLKNTKTNKGSKSLYSCGSQSEEKVIIHCKGLSKNCKGSVERRINRITNSTIAPDDIFCEECAKIYNTKPERSLGQWLEMNSKDSAISLATSKEEWEQGAQRRIDYVSTNSKLKAKFRCELCNETFEIPIRTICDREGYYTPDCCKKGTTRLTLQDWTLLFWGVKIMGDRGYNAYYNGKLVYHYYNAVSNAVSIGLLKLTPEKGKFVDCNFRCKGKDEEGHNIEFSYRLNSIIRGKSWCLDSESRCKLCEKDVESETLNFKPSNIDDKRVFEETLVSYIEEFKDRITELSITEDAERLIRYELRQSKKFTKEMLDCLVGIY